MRGHLRIVFAAAGVLLAITLVGNLAGTARAQAPAWDQALARARGQTVFWNAWGGDERINAYIAWVGRRVAEDHGVTLRHVKLSDTADAVARVLAERPPAAVRAVRSI